MGRWIVAGALIVVTACGGSRSSPTVEAPSPAEGTYEFVANTPTQVIRGTVNLTSSGVGVQFEAPCQPQVTPQPRPRAMPSAGALAIYQCSGAWLTFDKSNPSSAKWYANIQQPHQREVCARYDTVNGRQVCASRTTETYYVNESRSGGIQVRRIP